MKDSGASSGFSSLICVCTCDVLTCRVVFAVITVSQSSKPFCTLTLGKFVRQTQILEKTASPTWNEAYNLYLPSLPSSL
jgi:hypothetical protein